MTKKQLLYLWQYLYAGSGGAIVDGLVLRPNFNDMANLSLTSPSNGSAVFNGSSDYVALPSAMPHAAFSFCMWVNRGADTGVETGFINGTGYAGNGWYTDFIASGAIQFINGTAVLTSSETGVGYNKWDFVTMTYDGSIKRIYINGSLSATSSATTISAPTTYFQFGRYLNTSSYFTGNLANVAVWNRALTSDEINSIMWKRYDLLTAGESTGLVAWYALDDITGTSVPDSTGTYNATAY